MPRPCFLVLDPEHSGSISTRKLVIETAKFNVITAYSSAEAVESVLRFPNIDGALLDARFYDMPPAELIRQIRELKPNLPVIVISVPGQEPPPGADYIVDSLRPQAILELLQTLCPKETEAIVRHDRDLEASGE